MIPKRIHQIWVGGDCPENLLEYMGTWRRDYPDWEYILWTDENLPLLANQSLYDAAEQIAPGFEGQFRADLARYELLERFGGLYIDADFESLHRIDILHELRALATWELQDIWIANGFLGCESGDLFMRSLVERVPESIKEHAGTRPTRMTGPQFLTRLWRKQIPGASLYRILPQKWFYPYSWRDVDRGSNGNSNYSEAYAVHHWHNRRRRLEGSREKRSA